jgi:hypothetical protein
MTNKCWNCLHLCNNYAEILRNNVEFMRTVSGLLEKVYSQFSVFDTLFQMNIQLNRSALSYLGMSESWQAS